MKSADEILEVALRKEKQARDFYQGLALHCGVEIVRELVERLRDEEAKHVKMIETMLSRLRLGHDLT
jgi:rubrerythrin